MGITIDKAILRVQHSSMSVDDKETADFIINTMRKYQKIVDIVTDDYGYPSNLRKIMDIREVLENDE